MSNWRDFARTIEMKYEELRKIFYRDRENYTSVYEKRFHADNTIRLDFEINGNQAFICQTEEVYSLIFDILTLDKEIYGIRMRLPAKASEQYSNKCLIDEIILTNNIEGVHSSRKEIGDALHELEEQSERKGRRNMFFGLVKKYYRLLSREPVSIRTCQDIREIYDQIVLEEVTASNEYNAPDGAIFRKELSEIYNSSGKVIHRGVYPETEIIRMMQNALSFLNDTDVNILVRICIFHYLFEYIHPFYDGNGRTGRFILSYFISEHLEYLLAFRISGAIKESLREYYGAFTSGGDQKNLGDLTPFLITMLTLIKSASQDLKDSLSEKYCKWKAYEKCFARINIPDKDGYYTLFDYLVQAALFSEIGISSQELLGLMSISQNTLKKRLDVFESLGLLITVKNRNRKYYTIDVAGLDALG